MKVFVVLKEQHTTSDGDVNEILNDESFTDCAVAYDKMLEDAQFTYDDWSSNDDSIKLELYPKVRACSVYDENGYDFTNYHIIELEVK